MPALSLLESAHAAGLQAEHATSQQTWPLMHGDKEKIHALLVWLAQYGSGDSQPGDIHWTWTSEDQVWMFGLVRAMDQSEKDTLAQHMLHRHGLAPLLASRGKADFDAWMRQREVVLPTREQGPKQFVLALEAFAPVKALKERLLSLSLSAMRNLHSYDHAQGPSFTPSPEKFPDTLQVALSQPCLNFMRTYGFSVEEASELKSEADRILGLLEEKADTDNVGVVDFLLGDAVGAADPHDFAYAPENANLFTKEFQARIYAPRWGDRCELRTTLEWEKVLFNGDNFTEFNFMPSVETCKRLLNLRAPDGTYVRNGEIYAGHPEAMAASNIHASNFLEAAYEVMMGELKSRIVQHKQYMTQHRDLLWASEEADLFEMSWSLSKEDGYPWPELQQRYSQLRRPLLTPPRLRLLVRQRQQSTWPPRTRQGLPGTRGKASGHRVYAVTVQRML